MPDKVKILRLFELAKIVHVTTADIIGHLEAQGYDLARKLVQPIDEAMYVEILRHFNTNLLHRYRIDRGKVLEALKQLGYQSGDGGGAAAILGKFEEAVRPAHELERPYVSVRDMMEPPPPSPAPVAAEEPAESTPPTEAPAAAEPPNPAHPFLPSLTVFAPGVQRARMPVTVQPVAPGIKEVPSVARSYKKRGPKMPKEPVTMRLLLRRPAPSPSARPISRPLPMIKTFSKIAPKTEHHLNNIDLELLEQLVNMSYMGKLELLERLMFGE